MKKITTEQLRAMENCEGLVLQGCGGDLREWIDGINGILREQGILQGEKPLDDVSVFKHEGLTNLLFKFNNHKLDIGKLVIWRIQTREQYGSMWLSDYIENRLGGVICNKFQGFVKEGWEWRSANFNTVQRIVTVTYVPTKTEIKNVKKQMVASACMNGFW